jgi:HEAT repeat protein
MVLVAGALQTAPQIQNGRVETRQASSIDREVAAVSGSADPVWVAWRVPIADGQRGSCQTYVDDSYYIRGDFLEGRVSNGPATAQITPPAGPVQIEGGSGLVVLLRIVDTKVERMRSVGDDCPLDAGGRTVYWLQGVTPAESLRYLETFLHLTTAISPAQERRLNESALAAIALHRDPAADAILDRLATADSDTNVRRMARSALGASRGAHGFSTLRKLLQDERLPDQRRQLVSALGQTRQPEAPDVLKNVARTDPDAKVRAEAVYWLPQRGGPRVVPDVTAVIDADQSDEVKQRAVRGLARLPPNDSVPLLLQLARSNKSPAVKKEAVAALGQSKDPRAIAFLEEILK